MNALEFGSELALEHGVKSSKAQGARVDPSQYLLHNLQPTTSINFPNPTTLPTGSLGLNFDVSKLSTRDS